MPFQPISFGDAGGADPGASSGSGPQTAPTSMPPIDMPPMQAAPLAPGPLPAPAPAADSAAAAASRRAGTAVLLAGVGVGTGALMGGLWGAGSGLFFAGALTNALRSYQLWHSDYQADRAEAVKTTVMTVIGVGVAGYLGYRAREHDRDDD